METADLNFQIQKGATFERELYVKDNCKVPIDLSGYTAAMQARYKLSDAIPFLDLTDGNGITLGGTDGKITITVDKITTAALTASASAVYDLQLTAPSGTSEYLIKGKIPVIEMVTR